MYMCTKYEIYVICIFFKNAIKFIKINGFTSYIPVYVSHIYVTSQNTDMTLRS